MKDPATQRLMLPLTSHTQVPTLLSVLPHTPTRISNNPVNGAFDLEHIFISNAGTDGGEADWIVNDIEIDGQSQLAQKNLPGALFGLRGVAANGVSKHAGTSLEFSGLTTVERNQELALVVSYIGTTPGGAPFFGAALGVRPPQRPTVLPLTFDTSVIHGSRVTVRVRPLEAAFQIEGIEIADGRNWLVDDLRVNGKSQFRQPGPIPGDLFETPMIHRFMQMETCAADSTIEIDAVQCQRNVWGTPFTPFTARLEGAVVREDYTVPPPDLHAILEIDGSDGMLYVRTGFTCQNERRVIGTCDWRPPATSDEAP